MSYDANFINDSGKIISPEVELLKIEIDSLKLMTDTLQKLGYALTEKTARLEEVLTAVQVRAVEKLVLVMDEERKSELHEYIASGRNEIFARD